MDFGTIMCMASNMVGMQSKPCIFHIIMAGKFLVMSIPPHIEYDFNPILRGGVQKDTPLGVLDLLSTKIELDVSNSLTFPSRPKDILC